MTPALWAQTWHADMISAEKHSADCVGACCYNLFLVFRPFTQDWQIFWDVSFSFDSPKPLRWPAHERDVKHMNSGTKQRQRELHLVLKCDWVAGMGMKKHWLWLIKFLSLEEFLWRLLPCSNTVVAQCALGTSASPKSICHTLSLYASSQPRYLYNPLWAA